MALETIHLGNTKLLRIEKDTLVSEPQRFIERNWQDIKSYMNSLKNSPGTSGYMDYLISKANLKMINPNYANQFKVFDLERSTIQGIYENDNAPVEVEITNIDQSSFEPFMFAVKTLMPDFFSTLEYNPDSEYARVSGLLLVNYQGNYNNPEGEELVVSLFGILGSKAKEYMNIPNHRIKEIVSLIRDVKYKTPMDQPFLPMELLAIRLLAPKEYAKIRPSAVVFQSMLERRKRDKLIKAWGRVISQSMALHFLMADDIKISDTGIEPVFHTPEKINKLPTKREF